MPLHHTHNISLSLTPTLNKIRAVSTLNAPAHTHTHTAESHQSQTPKTERLRATEKQVKLHFPLQSTEDQISTA